MNSFESESFLMKFSTLIEHSQRSERSNSARHRYYKLLREAVFGFRHEITRGEELLAEMRSTSGFDSNEQRFAATVSSVFSAINNSPSRLRREVAAAIRKRIQDQRDDAVLQKAAKVLDRRADRAVVDILRNFNAQPEATRIAGAASNNSQGYGSRRASRERRSKVAVPAVIPCR